MRTRILCALALVTLVAPACSGQLKGGEDDGTTLQQKTDAANAIAEGTAAGDPCDANRWYGDGTCDSFCPGSDSDCVPNGGSVVCTMLSEISDGVCGRDTKDPCLFQDPDCNGGTPDHPGQPDPDEPVACAYILEASDAVCSRSDADPCRGQDPDCSWECPAIAEVPDGVCEDRPSTRCGQDPDCMVACPAIYIAPDGICPGDPCDPDCQSPKPLYDCDTSGAFCDMVAPTCPAGETPSVSGGCYGPCVPFEQCLPMCGDTPAGGAADPAAPALPPSDGICNPTRCGGWDPDCDVACDTFVERPDGVCSRSPYDACRFQDPDCENVSPPGEPPPPDIACAEYIEEPDGVCSRPADDPCIFQDPDCGASNGGSDPGAGQR